MLVDLFNELAFGYRADDLSDNLATFKEEQGGDAANIVLLGHQLVVVDIHFTDFEFAYVFASESLDRGANGLTRPAPLGPKINKSDCIGFDDLVFEVFVGEFGDVCIGHFMTPFGFRYVEVDDAGQTSERHK